MKIYTRKGDKGITSLIGGRKVSKAHIRIEAYGTVDELIVHIGLLRDLFEQHDIKQYLTRIQDRLMTCATILASDCENCKINIPEISKEDVIDLEKAIDLIEESLTRLNSFILPGGHLLSSHCHIARTVCRRAERQIIRLSAELFVPEIVIKYINRLSDYLFMLARKVLKDFNIDDLQWRPKL
jgi:cob(I)alamin adenosyltransferase